MKINLSGFYKWLKTNIWQLKTIYRLLFIVGLSILALKLSILPRGASYQEIASYNSGANFRSILENPLFLPYKLFILFIDNFWQSVRYVRFISLGVFGVCTLSIYSLLKRWHSSRIAFLSTALFVSNATVLSIARLGVPLIMLFGWAVILSVMLWLQHGKHRKNAFLLLAIATAAYIYVPGAPYFYILMAVVYGRNFRKQIKRINIKFKVAVLVFSLILVTPLIVAFIKDTSVLREWLLLPHNFNLPETLRNILRVPAAFIYRSPINPSLTVGRLPIFDLVSGALFLLGLYSYRKYLKLERTKIMLVTALLTITLGALGQVTYAIAIVLPYAFIVIAAGISYLLDEWYSVFPKNPVARQFGMTMVVVLITAGVYYQSFRYFVVMQHSPQTVQEYSQPRLIQ